MLVLLKSFKFDSPRDVHQRNSCTLSDPVQSNREAVPLDLQPKVKASLTSEDGHNYGTIPMPTFASTPLTSSSTISVELPQNYMVGQQRQQISELQLDKFLIHHHSWCGRPDSKHRDQMVLIFRRKPCYGSQKWKWFILWMS